MNKYCPIKDKPCNSSCAWHVDYGRCSFILSVKAIGENLKAINSKLIEPARAQLEQERWEE